jgi:hypothetical protein
MCVNKKLERTQTWSPSYLQKLGKSVVKRSSLSLLNYPNGEKGKMYSFYAT